MANRTTAKSNITSKCVPTVDNAKMIDMLNNELAENIVFKEDVAVIQNSAVSNITVDFTGKDRIDLTRTGGSLNITAAGIADGQTVYLLLTKTTGQAITWTNVTDITAAKGNVTAGSVILYEIVRKSSYYFAKAWIESPVQGNDTVPGIWSAGSVAEHNSLTSTSKLCVPGRLPKCSESQRGLVEWASDSEIDAGEDTDSQNDPLCVRPSDLIRKLSELANTTWIELTKEAGWSGNVYYVKDPLGFVHVRFNALSRVGALSTGQVAKIAALPANYRPIHTMVFLVMSATSNNTNDYLLNAIKYLSTDNSIYLCGDPNDYNGGHIISGEIIYKAS